MLEDRNGKLEQDHSYKHSQLSNYDLKFIPLQKDFSFQVESTWYQFTCLIKILSKFSDFIYAKISSTQFSIFLKSPTHLGIRISYSIPLRSFDIYEFNLESDVYLCISLDDLKNVIERFNRKTVSSFAFLYYTKSQQIALSVDKRTFYLNLLDYTPAPDEVNFSFNSDSYTFKLNFNTKELVEIIIDESIFSGTLEISYNHQANILEFNSSHDKCNITNTIELHLESNTLSSMKESYSFDLAPLIKLSKPRNLLPSICSEIEVFFKENKVILYSASPLGTFMYCQPYLENSPQDISEEKDSELIDFSVLEPEEFIHAFKDRPNVSPNFIPKKKVRKYLQPKKQFSPENFLEEFKDDRKKQLVYKETHFTNSGNSIHSKVSKNDAKRRRKAIQKNKVERKKEEKKFRERQRQNFRPIIKEGSSHDD